ncbi:hypothetical protein CEXT_325141 [Caerostris extrusa]|uniref:Uncharacterized protein n=1 Tax=Caerostris extrusa TaxID=172846 RepID=A0AAV4XTP3_CAEEX|nr:hypothetical protein CEXT_325141 [Caerostris extrusa]
MVVDSVFKVELGEKIIDESMADFSKNVITDDSIEEIRQDKNVPNALTTDVLPKFHENVRKNKNEIILEPSISNVNVEKIDKNAMGVSYSEILVENEMNTSNVELKAENPLNGCSGIDMTNDKSKISIDESHQVEGVINALIIEVLLGLLENVCKSTTEISESSAEILKVKKENRISMDVLPTQPVMVDKSTTANLIREEVDTSNHELRTKSAIEVSQEVVRISEDVTVQPYPVHLFCSNSFDPSLMEYLSSNYLDFESVEYILPEVNPPSLVHDLCYSNYILRSQLRNEAKKNLNASIESEKRKKPGSCKRPNMSGPDIFFSFSRPVL